MTLSAVNTGDLILASHHNEIRTLLKTTDSPEWITFSHKGADLVSAGSLSLGGDGNYFDITGTTGITAISTRQVGTQIVLQFDGAVALTHSAALSLIGGADYTTTAGDRLVFISEGSGNWREISRGMIAGGGYVTLTGTQTLTNKTLTSPVVNTQLTGTAVGTGASQVAAGNHTHAASNVVKEVGYAEVDTRESTTSVTYTDLTTGGPSVTMTAVASDNLDAFYSATVNCASGAEIAYMAPMLDAVAASDENATYNEGATYKGAAGNDRIGAAVTAASHTVALKYRTSAGTSYFDNRKLTVIRSQ